MATEKKMGRPRVDINQAQFESLCGIQCTLSEVADFFHCSEDTIERWCKREYGETFADTFKKHSGKGKISLRRAQFKLAEKNASMAIWLGKQYLGQKDFVAQDEKNSAAMEKLDTLLREFNDAVKSEAN
jgi:AraC-like DNA-binding protein